MSTIGEEFTRWMKMPAHGVWRVETVGEGYLLDCDRRLFRRLHQGTNALVGGTQWAPYRELGRCELDAAMLLEYEIDGKRVLLISEMVLSMHQLERAQSL